MLKVLKRFLLYVSSVSDKDFVGKGLLEIFLDFTVRLPLLFTKNPSDTWGNFLFAALISPNELRSQYDEEVKFVANLESRWRR